MSAVTQPDGCGDTDKPGENIGGGGTDTGNGNEDSVPDIRLIVRVD